MPPDNNTPITSLAVLREMTPREIDKARRDGRLDLAALSADRARLEAEQHRQARIAAGLIPPDPTTTEPQGA